MNTKMNPTVKHASTKSVLKPQDPLKVVNILLLIDTHNVKTVSFLSSSGRDIINGGGGLLDVPRYYNKKNSQDTPLKIHL